MSVKFRFFSAAGHGTNCSRCASTLTSRRLCRSSGVLHDGRDDEPEPSCHSRITDSEGSVFSPSYPGALLSNEDYICEFERLVFSDLVGFMEEMASSSNSCRLEALLTLVRLCDAKEWKRGKILERLRLHAKLITPKF